MNSDLRELGGRDPHTLLGLHHGASQEEVIRAFRQNAARGGHPDTGGDSQTFRQLTRARDILLDERRRTAYAATSQNAGVAHSCAHNPRRSEPARTPFAQSGPELPAKMTGLTITTLVLAFLGPLAWPAALVTGHMALRRIKRAGQPGPSLLYVAMAFLYVLSLVVLPGFLTIAIVSVA